MGKSTDKPSKWSAAHRSKASVREELEQATKQFLSAGGSVNAVPTGVSAWEPGTRPPPSRPLFEEPRSSRTPVQDVVATIEARRESLKTRRKPVRKPRSQRRRRRVIYDDFGEPLRHVWENE